MQRQALELGLRGWGQTTADGRVEGVFEGEPEAVWQMLGWFYSDRLGTEVHATSVYQGTPSRNLVGFKIR